MKKTNYGQMKHVSFTTTNHQTHNQANRRQPSLLTIFLLAALSILIPNVFYAAKPSAGNDKASLTILNVEEANQKTPTLVPFLSIMIGSSGTVSIKNNSTHITARNVRAIFPREFFDVQQDPSDCDAIAPLATCRLRFIAGDFPHPATLVTIAGTNTTTTAVTLEVTGVVLNITGSPLTMVPGSFAFLSITNTSSSITALNIASRLESLGGALQEVSNTCQVVDPGQTCTIQYVAFLPIPPTEFIIQGSNTAPAVAIVEIG